MATPRPIILRGRSKLLEPVVTALMGFYMLLERKDVGTIYGVPSQVWQSEREFKPQILLTFKQDAEDVVSGADPIDGRISFRIMDEVATTISRGELTVLATKIKTLFIDGGGYVWGKGKKMCSYTDWNRGYQFQLLCSTESEGRQLVTKLLDIQTHVPDWSKFSANSNDAPDLAYPDLPGVQTILGDTVKIPRKRPIANVRFQHAVAHIHGLSKPVALCDRSRKLVNPLV